MLIGDRLRDLRESKNLTQGDIERRTGLLRCYISRVENGHTVPAIETLEKIARAMEIPLNQLVYVGNEPPKAPELPKHIKHDRKLWGATGKDARTLRKFLDVLSHMNEEDRKFLLSVAREMARKSRAKA
jgi:transcriptional regulator with XRE-family HTH domain